MIRRGHINLNLGIGVIAANLFAHGMIHASEIVSIEQQSESLLVKIDEAEFTVFHYPHDGMKSYFWPVRAADGTILTRPIDPNEREHPHHKGIWIAVDEVNDIKFWAEKGKIAPAGLTFNSGNPARITVTNDWLGRDAAPVLHESTTIDIYPDRMMVFDITLATPVGRLVRFDDTKEGFLAIRIAQSMRELEGGSVVNSQSRKTTAQCWGQQADWVCYTGPVAGKSYGVALMDFPENTRRSRYHVRDYGLFSLSPFGEGAYQMDSQKAQPIILDDQRSSIRFRYGVQVYSTPPENVSGDYIQFLKRASNTKLH